jgi:biopolymer transport protein TolR
MGAGVSKRQAGGGRRGRRRAKPAAMSEINVTPFVDVMLVLLIIFMVAAPMMTVGVPIELPETAATALPHSDEEPLSITLTADGRVLLMNNEESQDNLVTKLRAIASERTDDKVFLRADGAVPYAQVAQIMGALNAGGFRDIGLVTEQGGPTLDAAPASGN